MKESIFFLSKLLLFSLYANIIVVVSLSFILGITKVLLANFPAEIYLLRFPFGKSKLSFVC